MRSGMNANSGRGARGQASEGDVVIAASVITAGFALAVHSFHPLSLSTDLADPAVPGS